MHRGNSRGELAGMCIVCYVGASGSGNRSMEATPFLEKENDDLVDNLLQKTHAIKSVDKWGRVRACKH
jgi:hypothetical protein